MWRMMGLPIYPSSQRANTMEVSSSDVLIAKGHKVFRWNGTSAHLCSNLLLKTGSAMVSYNIAQSFMYLCLENLQGWRMNNASEQTLPLPGCPCGEERVSHYIQSETLSVCLSSFHCAPLWKAWQSLLNDIPTGTEGCCKVPQKPPLLQAGQCSSLSLSLGHSSSDHLSGLNWTCSGLLMYFLYWAT